MQVCFCGVRLWEQEPCHPLFFMVKPGLLLVPGLGISMSYRIEIMRLHRRPAPKRGAAGQRIR